MVTWMENWIGNVDRELDSDPDGNEGGELDW